LPPAALDHVPIARSVVDLMEYSKGTTQDELVALGGSAQLRCEIDAELCPGGFRDAIFWLFRNVVLLTCTACPAIRPVSGWTIHSNAGDLALIALFDRSGTRPGEFPFFRDNTERLIYLYGAAFAVNYLHSFRIFHADLTPANIAVDSDNRPRITLSPFLSHDAANENPASDLTAYRKLFAGIASRENIYSSGRGSTTVPQVSARARTPQRRFVPAISIETRAVFRQ
jgi:hypothetical protein